MKFLVFVLSLLLASSALAGTLKCQISKEHGATKILKQTSFAKDDPDEASEKYETLYDNDNMAATVVYFPHQNGVDLILEQLNGEVEARANFDQKSDDYMDLDLKIGYDEYRLECWR